MSRFIFQWRHVSLPPSLSLSCPLLFAHLGRYTDASALYSHSQPSPFALHTFQSSQILAVATLCASEQVRESFFSFPFFPFSLFPFFIFIEQIPKPLDKLFLIPKKIRKTEKPENFLFSQYKVRQRGDPKMDRKAPKGRKPEGRKPIRVSTLVDGTRCSLDSEKIRKTEKPENSFFSFFPSTRCGSNLRCPHSAWPHPDGTPLPSS